MANLATRAGVEGRLLRVHTLIGLSKAEIVKLGRRLGVDYRITWSCYDPTPDGQPAACVRVSSGRRGSGRRGWTTQRSREAVIAMAYTVKEIFYTLQGEGANTGRPAVFCRFAGCNLWTGREADREAAVCRFCDTDFVGTDGPGGGKFPDADSLAGAVAAAWPPGGAGRRFVVCTGGEPLLQLDRALLDAFHAADFEVAVETNGTVEPPPGIDWLCVSPQGGGAAGGQGGDELRWSTCRLGPIRRVSRARVRPILPPAHGRAGPRGQHRRGAALLPGPSALATEPQTHKLLGIP